jgi:hypothetical protein
MGVLWYFIHTKPTLIFKEIHMQNFEVLSADAPTTPAMQETILPTVNYQGQRSNGAYDNPGAVSITPATNIAPMNAVNVAAISTGNVNIASGLVNGATVDGVVLATGNLVLLVFQNDSTVNGCYTVVASGAASLTPQYASAAMMQAGRVAFIATGGTVNKGAAYLQRSPDPLIIGTSDLLFTKFSGQIQVQQNILEAVVGGFQRLSVLPNFQSPNPVNLGGTQSFDNSDLAGFLQFPDAQAATTGPLASLTGASVVQDGVTLTAGQTLLVKNGITADAYTAAKYSTTAPLPAYTYNNGTAGVGATITANADGALPAQDGQAITVNDRILVAFENGLDAPYNGIYTVTQVGNGGAPFILTRSADNNDSALFIVQKAIPITSGTEFGGTQFVFTEPVVTVGTDSVLVVNQSGSGDDIDLANGLYTVGTVTGGTANLTRRADFATAINFGSIVFVEAGAANGQKNFYVKTANPIVVGTTPILFGHLSDLVGTFMQSQIDNSGKEAAAQYSQL